MGKKRRRQGRRETAAPNMELAVFGLLALILASILSVRYIMVHAEVTPETAGMNEQIKGADASAIELALPIAPVVATAPPADESAVEVGEGKGLMEQENIEAVLIESGYYRDDVPLPYDLQDCLHMACQEANIPYALALAVIEKETHFENINGDDGASEGYMQVQRKWHYNRMERLGVTNLMEPFGNFRVGCDFLEELLDRYGSADAAVTVYNWGHNPGYITPYGKEVMGYYEQWKGLVGDEVSGIKG